MKWRSGTLDDLYFEWLYAQIADVDEIDPRKTYWELMRRLYCTEFLYFIPNDDNRAQDGLELRELFADELEEYSDPYWDTLPCSIFEMLVSLARRMEFEGGRSIEHWFWMFMRNLGFSDDMADAYSPCTPIDIIVNRIAHTLNHRLYSWSGHGGGLFPLNAPREDQRTVELWYQMAAYLREEV